MVRRFQEGDLEVVLEIFSSIGLIHGDEERDRYRGHLRRAAIQPPWYDTHLVAEFDGRVVGRVILEAAYPPYSELINLYVRQNYHGRGVGTCLVQACIEAAKAFRCFVMTTMTDPMGNLPVHRLYSKFSFRPGIHGDPHTERGHTWLFRFSEESCVAAFLRKHPFAEPHVSPSKADFHGRPLYSMHWRDPQTGEALALYLEGKPSQTPEGTMPRIAGFSYKEGGTGLEGLAQELVKTIREEGTSGFKVYLWNNGSRRLEVEFGASIPLRLELNPSPQDLQAIDMGPNEEKKLRFEIKWLSGSSLPYTTFPTIFVTFFLLLKGLGQPLLTSVGFEYGG